MNTDAPRKCLGWFRAPTKSRRVRLLGSRLGRVVLACLGWGLCLSGPAAPEADDEPVPESPELRVQVEQGRLGWNELLVIRRREINPSHVYTYHVEGFGAGGGLGVATVTPSGTEYRELVSSPEGQILDCDLSFDGREILFSWRRTRPEGYQVFVVGVDGEGLRPLTEGKHHNYNACWLPDGGIAFLSTRSSRFAYCWVSPVGVLHRMERDGSGLRQLSANIVNDFTPSVMADGRILYSRWEYVDKPAIPIQSLWTVHPDGTLLSGFFGNRVLSPATFMEARSIPGDSRVLCTLTSHNGPARGAIGIIDARRGMNAPEAIRNLTPWVDIGSTDQGDGNAIRGPYENPYPVDGEFLLVSRRGTVLLRDYAGRRRATLLKGTPELGYYQPTPMRKRPRPPVLVSNLDVAEEPESGWATLVLQDIYRGLEPTVRRGEVRRLAVVEEMKKEVRTDVAHRAFGFQFPVISCGATYAAKKVWGFATVARDGSATFRVPAGRPIYFLALDARGRAVQRMRTFTHLMPGEVQGCVGCHESRAHSGAPAAASALRRAPEELEIPEWGRIGFDYSRIVQPVLDQHCVRCHEPAKAEGGIDLSGDKTDFFNVSYDVLARGRKRQGEAEWDSPHVDWIPTYNGFERNILEIRPKAWGSPRSPLADLLIQGHPDRDGKPRLALTEAERHRVLLWIDLNVPYYGTSETAYPEEAGCRRIYPSDLDRVLKEVAQRRCVPCHRDGQVPRPFWTRVENPQWNSFLTAPLSRAAGGTERCGTAVFPDPSDPDYQALLRTFDSPLARIQSRPRLDMPGGIPAEVDRSCLGDAP